MQTEYVPVCLPTAAVICFMPGLKQLSPCAREAASAIAIIDVRAEEMERGREGERESVCVECGEECGGSVWGGGENE